MSEDDGLFNGLGFEIFPAELQAILKVIDAEKIRISFESTSALKIETRLELCCLSLESKIDLRNSAPDTVLGNAWNVPVKPIRQLLSALPPDELQREREYATNEYNRSEENVDTYYPNVMMLYLFFKDNSVGFDLCFNEFSSGEIYLEVPATWEEIPKTLEKDKPNELANSKINGLKVVIT